MADEPTLKRGHNNPHDWVVYAQKMLNQALAGGMHVDIAENGVFDETMEQEVVAFQTSHGAGNDGEIGPTTWAALHRAIGVRQQQNDEADADEEDELSSPAREVHNAPGHRDDENFHERTDRHGEKVRVYDMDAEEITVTPGAHVDWNSVVAIMVTQAEKNTGERIPYVLSGILEFQTSSQAQIQQFVASAQQFEHDSQANFPWSVLVDGLDHALGLVFTVDGPWAGWIYQKVKGALISGLVDELTSHTSQVPGLEAKLHAGVSAMVDHANRETVQAVDEIKAAIPDYLKEQMQAYQQVTNDPTWINEMVTYFGFPETTEASVTAPIVHSLTTQFDAMVRQAEEELFKNVTS